MLGWAGAHLAHPLDPPMLWPVQMHLNLASAGWLWLGRIQIGRISSSQHQPRGLCPWALPEEEDKLEFKPSGNQPATAGFQCIRTGNLLYICITCFNSNKKGGAIGDSNSGHKDQNRAPYQCAKPWFVKATGNKYFYILLFLS